jgi:hypothetical protein
MAFYCDVAFVFVIVDSYKIEAIRSNEMSTESLIWNKKYILAFVAHFNRHLHIPQTFSCLLLF